MSLKMKLISTISAFMLVLGLMLFGVFAATNGTILMGGNLSFTATNVYAKVTGQITGAGVGNKTFEEITFSSSNKNPDTSDWRELDLDFDSEGSPITIEITVENLAKDRTLSVNVQDNFASDSGVLVKEIVNDKSEGEYTGSNVVLSASTGEGTSTTIFTITFSLSSKDNSLTDVNFGYIINLFDVSHVSIVTAETNNETLGTATGSGEFKFGEEVTLTADFTENAEADFLGWKTSKDATEYISTLPEYTFTFNENSPTTYYAEFLEADSHLAYNYDTPVEGEAQLASCSEGAISIIVPSAIYREGTSYIVTSMYDGFTSSGIFYPTRSTLQSILLPETLTNIGSYAFYYCSALTGELVIPENVTSIGYYAFYRCNGLTGELVIPEGVTSIGYYAFSSCSGFTGELIIPEGVTSIGVAAFSDCSGLTSIVIPDSVTYIEREAFEGCDNLQYNIDEYGVNYLGNIDNPYIYLANYGEFTGGDYIVKNNCKFIGSSAFYRFFGFSGLKSIILPSSLISIGDRAFGTLNGLETMNYLGTIADWCAIDFDSAESNPTYFTRMLCIQGQELTTLDIPEGVANISDYAFYNCRDLTSVTLPSTLTSIGNSVFRGCIGLTRIELPSALTSIGNSAFQSCYALAEVYNFSDKITIQLGNTSSSSNGYLGQYAKAVYNASVLEIEIPSSKIQTINDVQYYADLENNDFIALAPAVNRNYLTTLILDSQTTEINQYAFSDCSQLIGNLVIPTGVTNIGSYAFSSCSGLTGDLVIPEGVTSIGERAFQSCINFSNVIIPENIAIISDFAFYNCSGLTNVSLPDTLSSIENSAFDGCSGLTSITIPEGVTNIGARAFADCIGLTSISLPSTLTNISAQAFRYCSGLTTITIPERVTNIGSYTFDDCSNLSTIIIEATTPPTLGSFVLLNTNITSIYVPAAAVEAYKTADDWSDYADRIFAIEE